MKPNRSSTRLSPASALSKRSAVHGSALGLANGFTLVELLVGMTLASAILLGVLTSYVFIGRQLARLANQQILETEARRTLAMFAQDVQRASAIDTTVTLNASRVSLTVPTATSSTTVTYYYNSGSTAATVTINGSNVSMPATALTRCIYNGSTVTSQTLLRYISSLNLTYYDTLGNAYSSYTNYRVGIKQVALEFSTQTGTALSGSQTPVFKATSNRLVLRNRGFLQ